MGGPVKNTRQQVERELSAVLHQHAEDAMKRTDTLVEHQKFEWIVADQQRTDHRRRWVGGGVAAAVAAVAIGVAVSSSDMEEDPSPPIAQTPNQTEPADLAAAEGFAAAFVDHDADAVGPYLASGTQEPWLGWEAAWKRDAAYGVKYQMEPCARAYNITDSTVVFTCPYAMHLLGSDEVGKGPFPDNVLSVTVADGKVRWADDTKPWETNGIGKHLDAVHTWVADHHPQNYKHLLGKEEQDVTPAEWPRWTRLWKQYTQEYVTATNRAR
jgi:hypothetical protein